MPTLLQDVPVATVPADRVLLAPTFTVPDFSWGDTVDTGLVLLVTVPICLAVPVLVVAGAVAGRLCGLAAVEAEVFFRTAGLATSPLLTVADLVAVAPVCIRGLTPADFKAEGRGFVGDVAPGLGLFAITVDFVALLAGKGPEDIDLFGVEERKVVEGGFAGENGFDFCNILAVPVGGDGVLLLTGILANFVLTAIVSFLSAVVGFFERFLSGALISSAGFFS